MKVIIIDYGLSNLLSVRRAVEYCRFEAEISYDPEVIKNAECLILPGVGAFSKGMEQLRSLVNGGQMTPHTYVWTQGMANWERAINVASLSCLFNGSFPSAPPKLPSDF